MELRAQVLHGAVVGEHPIVGEPDHGRHAAGSRAFGELDGRRQAVEPAPGQPDEVVDLRAQDVGELLAV